LNKSIPTLWSSISYSNPGSLTEPSNEIEPKSDSVFHSLQCLYRHWERIMAQKPQRISNSIIIAMIWSQLNAILIDLIWFNDCSIIVVKNAFVAHFKGRFRCVHNIIIEYNSDLPEVHILKEWYDREGQNATNIVWMSETIDLKHRILWNLIIKLKQWILSFGEYLSSYGKWANCWKCSQIDAYSDMRLNVMWKKTKFSSITPNILMSQINYICYHLVYKY
jgi:hypothetical protein